MDGFTVATIITFAVVGELMFAAIIGTVAFMLGDSNGYARAIIDMNRARKEKNATLSID